jgi:hypothetical protein
MGSWQLDVTCGKLHVSRQKSHGAKINRVNVHTFDSIAITRIHEQYIWYFGLK